MDIVKVIAFAIAALILIIIVKEQSKEIAVFLIIVASIAIFIYLLKPFQEIISLLNNLIEKSKIDTKYISILLKVIGISYLVELTKDTLLVKTGKGTLSITELQMEGKKRMYIEDFLRGNKLETGQLFGKLEV